MLDQRHGRRAEGQHRRRRSSPTRSMPTTSSPTPRRWNDVIVAYRNGAPVRIRDIGRAIDGPAEHASWRPGRTASAASCCWSSSSPAPTSSTRSSGSRRQLPRLRGGDPARDQGQRHRCDRTQTIRASVDDVQFTLLLSIVPGGDGDLPVPAQRLGDDHPERHRAAGAGRHLRA